MTPHFITPCFVRVEDADKRKEICQQLQEMGYVMNFLPKTLGSSTRNSVLVNGRPFYGEYREPSCFLQKHRAGLAKSPETDGWQFVNCGTDIDLFLALAGMRSDTDEGQWFVAQSNILFKELKGEVVTASKKRYITIGEMFMPLTHNLRFTWFGGNSKQQFHRATTPEIIEHFKMRGNRNEVPAAAANYDRKTTLQDIDYE